jgi:L-lactate dehydrogenase complex protein LldG
MSDRARTNILARLKAAPRQPVPEGPDWVAPTYGDGRLDRFRTMLESVHGEVCEVSSTTWPDRLATLLAHRGATKVLAGPAVSLPAGIEVVRYDRPVEEWKDELVHGIDAGITWAKAAVADTGSVVLWPDADEPRLVSLLPPIHVALLKASTLVDNLAQLMAGQNWANSMPTNALLISGPSKTADIEQTLAYGVHGPKELIVLVLTDA